VFIIGKIKPFNNSVSAGCTTTSRPTFFLRSRVLAGLESAKPPVREASCKEGTSEIIDPLFFDSILIIRFQIDADFAYKNSLKTAEK
jgi:hypothetical protein